MNTISRCTLTFVLACFVTTSLAEKPKGKKKNKVPGFVTKLVTSLEAVDLTEEQTEKIVKLGTDMAAKTKEIRNQAGLTLDMMATRSEKMKEMKGKGKPDAAMNQKVDEAAGWTPEQSKARAQADAARDEFMIASLKLLDETQQAALPKNLARILKKSQKGKKKKDK